MTRAHLLMLAASWLVALGIVELAATRRRPATPRRAPFTELARILSRRYSRGGSMAQAEAAGFAINAGEWMLLRVGAGAVGMLVVMLWLPAGAGRLGPSAPAITAVISALLPDLWLRRRVRSRAIRMESEEADVLDLVRVAVGAGLSPWQALAEVGRRHAGLLAAELGRAARQVALGVPAQTALDQLERRCPFSGSHALCALLGRTHRLGASPARALGALAIEARSRQARIASERAAKAAPKIQVVVALLLVPSVLLLVAAALIPALTGGSF